ncbi:hypothetical protein CRE_09850 [Caenorhabditis remanei]|uniref:Retrotransposon gag domain-containing protein n=1 Tax=Caenorhabditis remanei TaxID=31234 RepID=E3NJY9_CAERE|nr:hypothetical protein CRE_09850 [Caenorhabditis remanei]
MANKEVLLKAHECDADKEIALQEISNIHQGKFSISEYAEKIRNLGTYAYDYLEATSRDHLMSKDWKTMSDAFVKLHECEADKEVALQEIATLSQGKMTIREFSDKIKRVGSYAYDDLETVSRERLMASQFLNGVHRNIRTEIRRLPTVPKTLWDMTLQAEKISRLLKIEAEEAFFTIPEYYRYTIALLFILIINF